MKKRRTRHFGLMLLFVVVLFLALVINTGILAAMLYFLAHNGMLNIPAEDLPHVGTTVVVAAHLSIPVGFLVSLAFVKFPLKPIRQLIDSMDALAAGDFSIRMNAGAIMKRYPDFVEVSRSFNKLAEQLESTEMLRSDFINNFSHEFKTPIVSIAGLAKVLKRGNLSREEQEQYLSGIEEESMRLSYMATNVLSLTKVENQTILSDVSEYNLSEQIRSCMLLLENKWSKRDLELQLDFGEHMISANEEQLKQVWINLLDNAVKFTPDGHTIQVRISETDHRIAVDVVNTGSEIPKESLPKIFNKFYQADESHATQGNGVGLAIVKRIAELHGGSVSVTSENEVTTFTVELPKS